jgi:hypothetical protein
MAAFMSRWLTARLNAAGQEAPSAGMESCGR